MAPVTISPKLPSSSPATLPLKQPRPRRNTGNSSRRQQDRPLGQDLPLREGVESLERWLDLNA
jgi:hypothetical protein